MESIRQAMFGHYGLHVRALEPVPGGWTADAYRARTATADYFVKVYDKQRSCAQPWIARMDVYMPITFWLHAHTALRDRMVVPLPTTGGQYKAEDERHILLVYPLLPGVTIGDACLSPEQIRQLAEALAELHSHGAQIPVATHAIEEDYSLPFLQRLTALLDANNAPAEVEKVLCPYRGSVNKGMAALRKLSMSLQTSRAHTVLCHTDIHGGNLMWTRSIVLVDWEGLRLAPAEADLFVFTDGFFFDYAGKEFLSAYRVARADYAVNAQAMLFYRLRRRIEDIAEFAHSIAHDNPSTADPHTALRYLRSECAALAEMLSCGSVW